jgi:hypothetical protein
VEDNNVLFICIYLGTIGETTPLSPSSSDYEQLQNQIKVLKKEHEQTLDDFYFFPRPAEGLARPWLFPCCNPPLCQCEENEQENFN